MLMLFIRRKSGDIRRKLGFIRTYRADIRTNLGYIRTIRALIRTYDFLKQICM